VVVESQVAMMAVPGTTEEGYVSVVDQTANQAFKVHPDTYQIALTATGLTGPYTYSDMTGAGLDLVTNPPG
jgi:hypothetical protein